MSGPYHKNNTPVTKYPGNGYYYVICDVCGGKFRQRDTVQIRDKYNTLNNLIVCFKDIEATNQQSLPYKAIERVMSTPQLVRPEQADVYILPENTNRVPGVPTRFSAQLHPLLPNILLTWQAPSDPGSDNIIQYRIDRWEQSIGLFISTTYTGSNTMEFIDYAADINGFWYYRISAINSVGEGPQSGILFWPHPVLAPFYEVMAQDEPDGTILGLADLLPNGDIQYIATDVDLG